MQIARRLARDILGCSIAEFERDFKPRLTETPPEDGHYAPTYDEEEVQKLRTAMDAAAARADDDASPVVTPEASVDLGNPGPPEQLALADPEPAPVTAVRRPASIRGGNVIAGGGPQKTAIN